MKSALDKKSHEGRGGGGGDGAGLEKSPVEENKQGLKERSEVTS